MELESEQKSELAQPWVRLLCRAVSNLKFGVVQVVVHDGKVVQIETTEKIRFRAGE